MRLDADSTIVVLLVEGKTDKELFKRVFARNDRVVCIAVGGKEMLHKLLDAPKLREPRYFCRIIAVRDRDYTDPAAYPPHMYAYDCCAMELMLLHHPKMQDMLKGFYTLSEPFPLGMMRRIALFSLLREDNEKPENKCDLNFEKPGVLAGSEKNMPNMEKLFGIYEKKSAVLQGQYADYQRRADELPDDDLWQITNGHDICTLLGNHYRLGDKLHPLDDVAYCFLMIGIYQPEYFQETDLYRDKLSTYKLPDTTQPFRVTP